jgi:hypothetical protein
MINEFSLIHVYSLILAETGTLPNARSALVQSVMKCSVIDVAATALWANVQAMTA